MPTLRSFAEYRTVGADPRVRPDQGAHLGPYIWNNSFDLGTGLRPVPAPAGRRCHRPYSIDKVPCYSLRWFEEMSGEDGACSPEGSLSAARHF